MVHRTASETRRATTALCLSLCLTVFGSGTVAFAQNKLHEIMRFAAQMAKQGNWREARYR